MSAAASEATTLFGALNSGHSYKIRMFLLLAGIPHAYRGIDLSVPREQRPADFRKVARFGEVPALVDDGEVLVQSNAILLHLARKHGRLWAEDVAGQNAITSWLFWEANRIGRSYPNLRYCRAFDRAADPGLVAWFEATARVDLDRLDQELADKPFLVGHPTIADLSCAAYMLYGDDFGFPLTAWPSVLAWLERIRALPGWAPPLSVMG
jgi:glutathione S-transferase